MGILRRIVSMTKAAANEVLDKIENPTMMMNHYLRDLEEQIAQTEQAVAEQQTQQRILQSKLDDCSAQIAHYEQKAEQAVADDREIDARMALEAKVLYTEQYEQNAKLQQLAAHAVIELKQRVEDLKQEHEQLKNKRTELMTRMQQSGASSSYPFASQLNEQSATQGFNRIEQKIMEWEAQQEIAKTHYSCAASASNTEQQQQMRAAHVDQELQRLLQKQESKNEAQQS